MKEKFWELAEERGMIGAPAKEAEEPWAEYVARVRAEIEACEEFSFAGPTGDVVARCYWADYDHREDRVGGCISVPAL